jgi:hypothetical protein
MKSACQIMNRHDLKDARTHQYRPDLSQRLMETQMKIGFRLTAKSPAAFFREFGRYAAL